MDTNNGQGFFLWGTYTSCGWYLRREEAERVARQLNYRGGANYTVRPAPPIATR